MKILYIDTHNIFGGGQMHLLRLVESINKEKYYPLVLCSDKNRRLTQELKRINVDSISIRSKILVSENKILKSLLQTPNFIHSVFKIGQVIKKRKIDIVQVNLFYSAIFGGIAAKIFRKPFVWTVHIPEDLIKYKTITRFIIALSNKVTPTCNDFINVAKENNLDTSKFQTVYSGLKIKNYHSNRVENKIKVDNKEVEKPIVAMVARIDPNQKRQQDFIEAAERILKEVKEAYFLVVGEASNPYEEEQKKEIEDLVARKKLSDKVIFTGFFPDLKYLLSNIEILVLPSLKESIPAIILEVMALKKPVVASNVGGIPEVVVNGETGFLVPAKNPEAIAEKVIFLLKNPKIAEEMGEKGYKRIKENFTQERLARGYEKLYESLLKNKSKSRFKAQNENSY